MGGAYRNLGRPFAKLDRGKQFLSATTRFAHTYLLGSEKTIMLMIRIPESELASLNLATSWSDEWTLTGTVRPEYIYVMDMPEKFDHSYTFNRETTKATPIVKMDDSSSGTFSLIVR